MEDSVIFKAEKKIFRLLLSESASLDDILSETEQKLQKAKDFFKGETITIGYEGRDLSEEEQGKIKNLFESIADIKVNEIIPYQAPDLKKIIPSLGLAGLGFTGSADSEENKRIRRFAGMKINKNDLTKFVKGTVRSGVLIQYDGNVVILGDVNPGSEVKATGNIVVMGTVKGLVHAGTDGDRTAFIAANKLRPTQLRIADLITRAPDSNESYEAPGEPEVANIQDNSIFIDPLTVFLNKK